MEIRRRLLGDYAVRATTNCRAQGCGWPPSTRYAGNGASHSAEVVTSTSGLRRTGLRRGNLVPPLRRSMAGWQDETPPRRRGERADRWRGPAPDASKTGKGRCIALAESQ